MPAWPVPLASSTYLLGMGAKIQCAFLRACMASGIRFPRGGMDAFVARVWPAPAATRPSTAPSLSRPYMSHTIRTGFQAVAITPPQCVSVSSLALGLEHVAQATLNLVHDLEEGWMPAGAST
jgi:hypothetical protein